MGLTNAKKELETCNEVIEKNLDLISCGNRGFISQNILAHLRNFIEAAAFYFYCKNKNEDLPFEYKYIKSEIFPYCKSNSHLNVLSNLHDLLQMTASHYTQNERASTTLMINYIRYLDEIKELFNEEDIKVLSNINKYPINLDNSNFDYYFKIKEGFQKYVNYVPFQNKSNIKRCYILKCNPVYIDNTKIYEITLTDANDYASKFDRVVAFSQKRIPTNYAISLDIIIDRIYALNSNIPVSLIMGYEISIRPCEFKNLGKCINVDIEVTSKQKEYKNLMNYLTNTNSTLLDIVTLNSNKFDEIMNDIKRDATVNPITKLLTKCNSVISNEQKGKNILCYLLYFMNNKIIKRQYDYKGANPKLSNLHFKYGCIPFDDMPFCRSLIRHNPSLQDLVKCFDFRKHSDELLARTIKENTESNGQIYCDINKLKQFYNIDSLIESYNQKLYKQHKNKKIVKYKNFIYIEDYEKSLLKIYNIFKQYDQSKISMYQKKLLDWIKDESNISRLAKEKIEILQKLFSKTPLPIIYGAAGTGKSTLINAISKCFSDENKLYVTNTHAALLNLQNKVETNNNVTFKTIASATRSNDVCKILFVDECSTINNEDILKLLEKVNYEVAVFLGDNYQIESIKFGNWFNNALRILPKESYFTLTETFRTSDEKLLNYWQTVRNLENNMIDKMIKYRYKEDLDDRIFNKEYEDEIILCLNYDGVYGINNINMMIQSRNPSKSFNLGINSFKVDDPILFNESKNYQPAISNNLKGKILEIRELDSEMIFRILVYKNISSIEASNSNLKYISPDKKGTVVELNIIKRMDTDSDSTSESILPFQIAYAVSIHKSQGLEYDSVKIVIADSQQEEITQNVFYTAITRAKKNLKIYCSEETANFVMKNLKNRENNISDVAIFANKNGIKLQNNRKKRK